ncbi:MAG: PTS sugar transporter subunit IIA [Candidatus Omnitrophica bacterium]|nr:PTS sugar transporter subunit IIA [Candidatus Omnitrophota bacterium]
MVKKHKKVSLFDVLPKELIVLNFNAKDKDDAIRKISDLFFKKDIIKDKEEFYRNLLARELIGSTGVGGGIAIPYAPSDTDRELAMGILVSKEGIDFDSLDNKPSHIFVPLTGRYERQGEPGRYLSYLAHISRLLKNANFKEEIKGAKTVNEVFNSIRKFENGIKAKQKTPERPYINDAENANWLQQVRLKGKKFDRVDMVSQKAKSASVYSNKNKLVKVIGDKNLVKTLTNTFTTPFKTMMGDTKEVKNKKGNIVKTIHSSYLQTFNPGDEGYIDAVLIDKVRNQLGMEIA